MFSAIVSALKNRSHPPNELQLKKLKRIEVYRMREIPLEKLPRNNTKANMLSHCVLPIDGQGLWRKDRNP
jgi:hypothetical protein